jgi:hypothetical protein
MQDRKLRQQQDALTTPGELAGLFADLPDDPARLRRIVSELIAHTLARLNEPTWIAAHFHIEKSHSTMWQMTPLPIMVARKAQARARREDWRSA